MDANKGERILGSSLMGRVTEFLGNGFCDFQSWGADGGLRGGANDVSHGLARINTDEVTVWGCGL